MYSFLERLKSHVTMLRLILAVVIVAVANAAISSHCLHAICLQESGCQPRPCSFDVTSNACGYYQIHHNYYIDCKSPGSSWQSCANNKACAETCVRNYMARYASRCTHGRTPTCEDYARVHNGGPAGCHNANTLGYWHLVQRYV